MKLTQHLLFTAALLAVAPAALSETGSQPLHGIQTEWAKCQYDVFNEDNKIRCLESLINTNREALSADPQSAELTIWLAINLSTLAGVEGGFGALKRVKEAKSLLERAIDIDPESLDGSAYTSLGSLYYQVPGWPLGFGDDDKAESLLKRALSINPDGIDPNYFYGDFLAENGRKQEALVYLERAKNAPPRTERPLADAGRQQEIASRIASLQ